MPDVESTVDAGQEQDPQDPQDPRDDAPASREIALPPAKLPIGTVEQIQEAAPKDIIEETIDVPEWGVAVKLRSATALVNARMKQRIINASQGTEDEAIAEAEVFQFTEGVIEPVFSPHQARKLQSTSSTGFQRIIARLDYLAGADKEELRRARDEFLESIESDADGVRDSAGPEQDA